MVLRSGHYSSARVSSISCSWLNGLLLFQSVFCLPGEADNGKAVGRLGVRSETKGHPSQCGPEAAEGDDTLDLSSAVIHQSRALVEDAHESSE
jgi:hypothetical protein